MNPAGRGIDAGGVGMELVQVCSCLLRGRKQSCGLMIIIESCPAALLWGKTSSGCGAGME